MRPTAVYFQLYVSLAHPILAAVTIRFIVKRARNRKIRFALPRFDIFQIIDCIKKHKPAVVGPREILRLHAGISSPSIEQVIYSSPFLYFFS